MTRYKAKTPPFIWITWLSKLLADEAQCHWSVWFRSHYTYDKLPSNFDSASWIAKHRALLDERVAFLEAEGYSISIEGENWFEVPGQQYPITVAGKPDIVAIRDNVVWAEDCKTGKLKNSDLYQVLLYMLLVPVGIGRCRGLTVEGRLIYSDTVVDIPATQVNDEFREQVRGAIANLSSATPPRKVPSFQECRYCDISSGYCPERMTQNRQRTNEHDLF